MDVKKEPNLGLPPMELAENISNRSNRSKYDDLGFFFHSVFCYIQYIYILENQTVILYLFSDRNKSYFYSLFKKIIAILVLIFISVGCYFGLLKILENSGKYSEILIYTIVIL